MEVLGLRVCFAALVLLLAAGPAAPQDQPPQPPQAAPADQPVKTPEEARIEELERQLKELAARVAELKAAEASEKPDEETATTSHTGPISGYMDFHLNRPQDQDAILDMHRFVLLVNHSFSDRIRFVGELEVEHAFVEGLEESGELEVEQAYLDFKVNRAFNVRAGILLAPVGIINERHEPPSYYGVERPFVDTFIIPTTWFDGGAGVHGTFGAGWRYEAYLMAPLDATAITAEEGLAETSQKGFLSNVRDIAQTARLEYGALPGLTLGTSFWRGKTGFNFPRVDSQVGLIEFDGR